MQPNQIPNPEGANQNNNPPIQTPAPAPSDPKTDNCALWALIFGAGVFLYHLGIAIIQPNEVTIWWYIAVLPIILGVTGLKSRKRKPLAIAGIALSVISLVIVVVLFTTIYRFS
jgi:hypothetical protein